MSELHELLNESEITNYRNLVSSTSRHLNEADTRHKVIDFVLHDLMAWPRSRVDVEEYIKPGFADYVLRKSNGDAIAFIEAKKEGSYFSLPIPANDSEYCSFFSIEKLLSDENICAAIHQVRAYCVDTGCEYACVTNGHEWIFFRTFGKNRRWDSMSAFVIRNPLYFSDRYIDAYNIFSYNAVVNNATLSSLLSSTGPKDRNIFFPKESISSYSHPITSNKLAGSLRPLVIRYFGVIGDEDPDFMNKCYVSEREYKPAFEGMRAVLEDSLSPYFKKYGVTQLDDTGKGGQIGGRLTKNIRKERKGEVLVLFGGKGSGKSTFLRRLLRHSPPRWLREHATIAFVDLLKVPDNANAIREFMWNEIVEQLDIENLLSSDRKTILNKLFQNRYIVAERQELSGLSKTSETYNVHLNSLVSAWKEDKQYCALQLAKHLRDTGRGVVIVLDNTDQYSGPNQDFCFTSAQEISDLFGCVCVVSMREERFYNSKIHGLLDAFQNSGFHISSPKPWAVFQKRLDYALSIIAESGVNGRKSNIDQDCSSYLRILRSEFNSDNSPLRNFLNACAQGDIRLSLDLFRSFVLSGYTNVAEMLNAGSWNFQIHQVIKPMMIPDRFFYDEKLSDIPNILQIRDSRNGSHFTALRILRKLSKQLDTSSPIYMPIAALKSYFAETFNMLEDLSANIDVLLKYKFIEANNRIDYYDNELDSIKITSYGLYMYKELAYQFPYVDLICTDCGLYSENIANSIADSSSKEYNYFTRGNRIGRVKLRVARVERFLDYLEEEEMRERELFSLGMPVDEMFTSRFKQDFAVDKERVLKSAERQEVKRELRIGRASN